jgi:hypothetical protein
MNKKTHQIVVGKVSLDIFPVNKLIISFLDYPHPRAEAGGGSLKEALSGKYK